MFTKIFYIVLFFSFNVLACSSLSRDISSHDHLPADGRRGLHGMVVFGSGPYFIEHIPMLQKPHDFQIVAQVVLKDLKGTVLIPDLSQKPFTLKPDGHFSLNDLISGKLNSFGAGLYQGSFEQNGKLIPGLESVQVVVTKILLARKLPETSKEVVFEVRDLLNTYQTQIITPEKNQQQIYNKTKGQILWCVTGPDFFEFCK